MSEALNLINKNGKPDPNVPQRIASRPEHSIWVGASAGTGKTKVLTDRVLRLLLPREDGRPGSAPGRILCLTFTKAAASEMAHRVQEILGEWAVMDEATLRHSLEHKLLGYAPSDAQLKSAQRLFADVIDEQNGLNIMTIHSFCQSILGRFPLEAGLPPYFDNIDEVQSDALLVRAIGDVLSLAQDDEHAGSDLSQALQRVVQDVDEKSFEFLIKKIVSERYQLASLLKHAGSLDALYLKVCDFYKIAPYQKVDDIYAAACVLSQSEEDDLRRAAEAFIGGGGKRAAENAPSILAWVNQDYKGRGQSFTDYARLFLRGDGEISSQAGFPKPSKKAVKIDPNIEETMRREAERVYDVLDRAKRVRSAQATRDVLMIGLEVITRYSAAKEAVGAVDFDDSIMRTYALLKGESAGFSSLEDEKRSAAPSWVMYKLDQRIDHILVDEAQDTNPEQWRVIEAIVAEFFDGQGAYEEFNRTSFTVGDLKQSIYSFQRAAPEEFQSMQKHFETKIKNAGQVYENVSLDISFRSTKSVLDVVDATFADERLRLSVGGEDVRHVSYREGQAGCVELWPLFQSEKKKAQDFWTLPIEEVDQVSGSSQLAQYIARNIRNWMDRKEILESAQRPIEAGDIMILVRSRSAFVDQMVRALKQHNIPVSGADRMELGQQLAVQDLVALARFCLHSSDDLTLAAILKSPFIGFTEEDLFALSYNRSGSLWDELRSYDRSRLDQIEEAEQSDFVRHLDSDFRQAVVSYLEELIKHVQDFGIYEFFSFILNTPCPADDQSGFRAVRKRLGDDALDPIEEFLNVALNFRYDDIDKMQHFIDVYENQSIELKREMDDGAGEVRIMTVHGSKGLQAPIVIMPDTIQSNRGRKSSKLLWPHQSGLDMPIYAQRTEDEPNAFRDVKTQIKDLDQQEYYRLLYVAMTRAADRLYIGGYASADTPSDESWYFYVERAMQGLSECKTFTDDDGHECLRVANAQNADADKLKDQIEAVEALTDIPDWAYKIAPEEPTPPRPLIPSRPSIDDMVPALSPLKSQDEGRFLRGNVTHKLLQFLPDFDDEKRENAALRYVQKQASHFSDGVQQNIIQEVLEILRHPDYAPFFKAGSMPEVPITGLMNDNRIVSGQIDRMLVEDDKVWIIDYKTNRPPPQRLEDVPALYMNQMRAYRDSIEQIYPGRDIVCALLWTDGPHLMILNME